MIIVGIVIVVVLCIYFYRTYQRLSRSIQGQLSPLFEFIKMFKPAIKPTPNSRKFNDLGATEKTRADIKRISDQLINRKRYQEARAKRPRAILLVGKKESGRQSIALAIAGELGAPFFYVSAHQLIEAFEGETKMQALLAILHTTPHAVIFIEYGEALLKKPGVYHQLGHEIQKLRSENPDHNTLLLCSVTYWDKFRRDGYFDDAIIVEYPDKKSRRETIKIYTQGISFSGLTVYDIEKALPDALTYAQIEWVMNNATVNAASRTLKKVTITEILEAVARLDPPKSHRY